MITYKAMYKFLDDGVHGELLDFPGVMTWGATLDETRRLLAGALIDMAEATFQLGEALPIPDATLSDPDADIEEPLHLLLSAATQVDYVPRGVVA